MKARDLAEKLLEHPDYEVYDMRGVSGKLCHNCLKEVYTYKGDSFVLRF